MEWIGITISLASSGLAALGVNLQALGLQKDKLMGEDEHLLSTDSIASENEDIETIKFFKSKLWTIGFCLYVIFETFGSVAALAFISPVILAPLGASGLVFNVLWSKILLGTQTSYLDGIGTGLIGIGAALVAWFGTCLPDGVVSYFIVQLLFMGILYIMIKYFEMGFGFLSVAKPSSPDTGSVTSIVSKESIKYILLNDIDSFSEVIGIFYSILGGIAASDTLLLTKTGIDMLIFSIFNSQNQFKSFISFFLLGCIGSSIFIQLYCLNRALSYEEPVVVIPLFYSVYTCLSVLNTIIYLNSSNVGEIPVMLIGLSFLISGVWVLRLARITPSADVTVE